MPLGSTLDLALLVGKITKPIQSSNVQHMQKSQYLLFIRRILQYSVFTTNKNYIYVAVLNHFNHILSCWAYVPRKQGQG